MAGELRLESPGTYIGIPTLHALLVAIQRSCLLSVARLHSTRWPEKTSQGASRRRCMKPLKLFWWWSGKCGE